MGVFVNESLVVQMWRVTQRMPCHRFPTPDFLPPRFPTWRCSEAAEEGGFLLFGFFFSFWCISNSLQTGWISCVSIWDCRSNNKIYKSTDQSKKCI